MERDRRAPVQGDGPCHLDRAHPWRQRWTKSHGREPIPPGWISWAEHLKAYADYSGRYGTSQSAERLAQRGGFGFLELVDHLGHDPETWTRR